uniref:Uncharacterized protein n=1 Tax=Romanomermis culicivorax TaxID=13658 RepID=A0A915I045_ROMCU
MAEKGMSRKKQAFEPLYRPKRPKSLKMVDRLTRGPACISPAKTYLRSTAAAAGQNFGPQRNFSLPRETIAYEIVGRQFDGFFRRDAQKLGYEAATYRYILSNKCVPMPRSDGFLTALTLVNRRTAVNSLKLRNNLKFLSLIEV